MKQIIVMVAMVALGIALASFVMGFKDTAKGVVESVQNEIKIENFTPASTEG